MLDEVQAKAGQLTLLANAGMGPSSLDAIGESTTAAAFVDQADRSAAPRFVADAIVISATRWPISPRSVTSALIVADGWNARE